MCRHAVGDGRTSDWSLDRSNAAGDAFGDMIVS